MKISAAFGVDEKLENDGVWHDLGDNARLLIGRLYSDRHNAVLRRLRKPHRKILARGKELPEELSMDILIRSMSEAVLLGWENLQDDDGKDVPYSSENAYRLMKDYKELRNLVVELASEASFYQQQETEEILGN